VPDLDAGSLRLHVFDSDDSSDLKVEATAFADGVVAGQVSGPANTELLLPVNHPRPWSPDDPFLYELRIVLKNHDRVVDAVGSYFGMRSVGLRRDEHGVTRITLNGKFTFELGALDQGFWPDGIYTAPTDAALQHDLRFLKSAGFNLVRKHVKVEPGRWYYYCDQLGLLVWQDMPSGNNNTPEGRIRFEAELRRMINQLQNHPCIVTWVIFNESWGQFDTERLTRAVKEYDPTRLVDSASGWTDKNVGDLNDAHNYPFPETPPADSARAVVMGEFGGLGLPVPEHDWSTDNWSYQTLPDTAALEGWYYCLLQEIWLQKEQRGLSAAIYTQTTDVETECNGLLTYDRRVEKISPARLAAMNSGELFRQPMAVLLTNAVFGVPVWRYTFAKPQPWWNLPAFDDHTWLEGPGGFGTDFTRGSRVRTTWNTSDIWLRRSFVLGNENLNGARFYLHHDKSVQVYLNGIEALHTSSYLVNYALFDIAPQALASLHPGTNCIAVHCDQTAGGQFIDVGIVLPPGRVADPP
jgi:Glycosyl hydrolases family 2, TIM barrel domain/Glycosyl hydrolases family 2